MKSQSNRSSNCDAFEHLHPADITQAVLDAVWKEAIHEAPKSEVIILNEMEQELARFVASGLPQLHAYKKSDIPTTDPSAAILLPRSVLDLQDNELPYARRRPYIVASHIRIYKFLRTALSPVVRSSCEMFDPLGGPENGKHGGWVRAILSRDTGNSFGIRDNLNSGERHSGESGSEEKEMFGWGLWADASFFNHDPAASGIFEQTQPATSIMTSTSKPSTPSYHAIIFGASGLAGWGVVDQLLSNYPSPGTFSKVTALVNRPMSVKDSFWPIPATPALQLVSGADFAKGSVEEFTDWMRSNVADVESVTHAFHFAYKHEADSNAEVAVNRKMITNVVGALNALAPGLRFLAFPTGAKGYGIHIPGGVFEAPLVETMKLPEAEELKLHHHALRDVCDAGSSGRSWTWAEIRPDAIIGFVPNGSAFNITAHWGTYLATYALVEGKGAEVPFPGTDAAYAAKNSDASSAAIAKLSIWCSLHPEKSSGELFNVADSATPTPMSERWSALAKYFGLVGTGPVNNGDGMEKPGEYMNRHSQVLKDVGVKTSEVFQGGFLDQYGWWCIRDRQFSLEKARKAGWVDEMDPNASWYKAFDTFKAAGMLPK
ncbi:hypothetical protein HWV62_31911 [Athelia sp. TMB]|nr:hypothetical protein HWV62_31911 [Athelia sp. TMB]